MSSFSANLNTIVTTFCFEGNFHIDTVQIELNMHLVSWDVTEFGTFLRKLTRELKKVCHSARIVQQGLQ